ncbi:ATP-binding protein, partial [Bacillus sp. HC-Mk]
KYFYLMFEELNRANSIITEFLSMGNTRKLDLQMLDLNSIIRDIIPLIKIDTYNQNKYIQVDTNDIPELLLNRNEIRQLLMNLYRNGLEAMNTGKVLTISTYKEGQNCVVLAVRDQGKGIRPEVLEKLGTPFYTTKDNGTGLGLGVLISEYCESKFASALEELQGNEEKVRKNRFSFIRTQRCFV